jgi:glycosyltransferase involved in cell wall biosynthesis
MRIAVTYGPMCLQRSAEETWADPRTGSEVGWRRIVEELRELGHDVESWTNATPASEKDVVISINEPVSLRAAKAKLRVCCFWLNDTTFCKEGQYGHADYDDFVDLYLSPSEAHRQKAIGDWGAPKPEKWQVNHLGCDDPGLVAGTLPRVPGRVVYCSSPDRGLHRVLEAWPAIKKGVPAATLRVFYRLEKWFRDFDTTPYYPPIEKLRARALWCEEALRRLSGPEWGITVVDSVSHDEILREMAQAEVLVHPCETTSWSEGFSVTVLEGCAAGACPIISDCDALGDVYAELDPVPVGSWGAWRDLVIKALTDSDYRNDMNRRARAIAERNTWKQHAKKLDELIRSRLDHPHRS